MVTSRRSLFNKKFVKPFLKKSANSAFWIKFLDVWKKTIFPQDFSTTVWKNRENVNLYSPFFGNSKENCFQSRHLSGKSGFAVENSVGSVDNFYAPSLVEKQKQRQFDLFIKLF